MTAEISIGNIAGTYEAARRYTRTHARSFYFASHVLPAQKRLAAYAVYAFCRFADNLVDDETEADSGRALNQLREQLHYVYTGSPLMSPGLRSFRETVHRYAIPEQYFLDLFRGMEMDLVKTRYETFEELEDYCYCVASVVGLIMAKVFGVSESGAERHARDLGTAMQLTNILRDIGEDIRRGRIYLPQAELRSFGVTEGELRNGTLSDRFTALMVMQVERARGFYRSGEAGLRYIPDDGSRYCVRLMGDIYSGILGRIEGRQYDVFSRRAVVPTWQKLRIAVRAGRTRTTTFSPALKRGQWKH